MNFARLKKLWEQVETLLDERKLRHDRGLSRLQKFAHFCVLVGRSFARNRCPVRASALAYATLLALIPMLAVVMGVTSTFLKQEGEEQIDQFIMKAIATVTPPAMLNTNTVSAETNVFVTLTNVSPAETGATIGTLEHEDEDRGTTNIVTLAESAAGTNEVVLPSFAQEEEALAARKQVARQIHDFIQNTRSGTLGITGTIVLIFVAISMLSRVEDTFNDIWGVAQGRSWFMRIVLYWGVISLAPLLLVLALALATGPYLESTTAFLSAMPFIGNLIFQFLPVVVLCTAFSLFYIAVPNTKVRWDAALIGGLTSGTLFHLNNLLSVLYVSRVVSNFKIYGSLGLIPVIMIGLYFAWLILLLGAQVAYAYQNRTTYFEEKQVETINQRGREFITLRLVTSIGQRFVRGEPGPTTTELAQHLGVPSRLIQQLVNTLVAARLLVETTGSEPAYLPARPIEHITCHDILMALRAPEGEDLTTRDEPTRAEVYGEFRRIEEAERQAAASVNLLALVHRAETTPPRQAIGDKEGGVLRTG